ncbi:MAG: hypothetical protein ABIT20_18015 [Gemmatimonadaceae bacterium]
MHARTSYLILLALVVVAGCSPDPVQWTENRTVGGNGVAFGLLPADGNVDRLVSSAVLPASACAGSLRLSTAKGTTYAVWWSPRPDSGARLLSAHTSDGGTTWSAVAPVDTMDRGVSGCRRPAPAIAADSASGYVHVTYGMVAPEGPGLFFSHSMDGGASFHAPVPILYGERLGTTSVAASGDHVVVAFEDPNSATPRIGLALSRTMGHIFEDRLLPVSDDNGTATQPLVAVQGNRITVAWRQRAAANGQAGVRVRSGTIH